MQADGAQSDPEWTWSPVILGKPSTVARIAASRVSVIDFLLRGLDNHTYKSDVSVDRFEVEYSRSSTSTARSFFFLGFEKGMKPRAFRSTRLALSNMSIDDLLGARERWPRRGRP